MALLGKYCQELGIKDESLKSLNVCTSKYIIIYQNKAFQFSGFCHGVKSLYYWDISNVKAV